MQTMPKFISLPDEMESLLGKITIAWARSSSRPKLSKNISDYWTNIINEWIETKDLPLYIRKKFKDETRGKLLIHKESGRKLIPTDNSPANWSFLEAIRGKRFSLKEIRSLINEDKIPIAMALEKNEKEEATFKCIRNDIVGPNKNGWKVCHKESIGLKIKGSITDIPLDSLKAHFRDFLSPSNMFLVPKSLSGLGELPEMVKVMKEYL